MKKRIFTSIFCIILSAFIAISTLTTVLAYSSDNDPIVTLSYLNDVVLPMLREEFAKTTSSIDEQESDTSTDVKFPENVEATDETDQNSNNSSDFTNQTGQDNQINNDFPENSMDNINENAAKLGTYELLELTSGQTVLCNSAVEIIVRPGSLVTVVSPFEAQGIADITNGNELLNDAEIPINAYCIIPRGNDDRGFYVHSENAYIMIRGEYTIG